VEGEQLERDLMNRLILEGRGYLVVWLLDLDIIAHTHSTCQKALAGIEEPGAQLGLAS
jgi:hypothetical protein